MTDSVETSAPALEADVWGEALHEYFMTGNVADLLLEDDDGAVFPAMHPECFFRDEAGWEPEERQLLNLVSRGPVLDLGAGAGRSALHLQHRGLDVTAVESSPGAAEVCRQRGVLDVRAEDLNDPPTDRPWATVLLLCGNLGLGGSWDANRQLLTRLAQISSPDALLIGDSVNYTGRAEIGLRFRSGNRVSPWWKQCNVSATEIPDLVVNTGWHVEHHLHSPNGFDHYVALRRA